jgi:type IV secretory pathway VirD2 relaxase
MSGVRKDGWDLPIFRPQMGRRASSDGMSFKRAVGQMRAASGRFQAALRHTPVRAGRARCDVRGVSGSSRRCVVKARYVPMRAGGDKAARLHLAYIERDGVERDGSQGRLFDGEGEVERRVFGAPVEGEKRQFRFIVAPEDGEEVDLRDFTRRLVDRMEKDLGRRLRWAAVCHHDTDNPHVHLVVRGVDIDGRDLRIDRSYISNSLRLRAQELATRELGPRSEVEVRRQLTNEISQERLTTIDRRLGQLASPERRIEMSALANAPGLSRADAVARLDVLAQLRLAERVSARSWRLSEGWQETLQRLGERGDIIKRMHQALPERPAAYRIFDTTSRTPVEGIVRHKGLHDEQTGAPFVIVETARKEAHYVRIDVKDAEQLMVGERVRVAAVPGRWLTAPDQVIARVAAASRGVYSAWNHQRELALRPVMVEGRRVDPESILEVNLRRLERLARYNLVTRLPDGNWRVPPNLVETLRQREISHPQHRIEIERLDRTLQRGRDRGPSLGR